MKRMLTTFIIYYLRYFARKTLQTHRPYIIGITGSVGKSSARNMLHAILKDHYVTNVVHGNSEIGIPLGIMGLKPKSLGFDTPIRSFFDWMRILLKAPFSKHTLQGVQYLIVEMGIDDPFPPKNMEYLLSIVKPDIGIVLNVGAVHTMQFEKLIKRHMFNTDEEKTSYLIARIADEKMKLITNSKCSVGIYNNDNTYIATIIHEWKHHKKVKLLSFGKNQTNTIFYKDYAIDKEGTTFTFQVDNDTVTIIIKDYLLPETYHETIAAVILAAKETGLSLTDIKQSLEKNFTLPNGRATVLKGIHESIIIDSSYNASRLAVEGMLDLLRKLKKQTNLPTVFLMGDMRELGEETQIEHEQVAEKMIDIVDYVYLVGPETRKYVLPIIQLKDNRFKEIRWFDTAVRAGEYIKENLQKNAIILVKGSQNTIFLEEAVKLLLANKDDVSKLCRQEDYWLKRKGVNKLTT